MATGDRLKFLSELERKVLWLASWMIHNANHLRPNDDGLKVGGHQASSASLATIMTTLYFSILRPQDRVAVKPHASPAFHAIQYLLGNQTRNQLKSMTSALPRRPRTGYGYIGGKRYLKLLANFRGTHGTGTPISAEVVKGKAFTSPTAAQAFSGSADPVPAVR